jgi:hypothetical protein
MVRVKSKSTENGWQDNTCHKGNTPCQAEERLSSKLLLEFDSHGDDVIDCSIAKKMFLGAEEVETREEKDDEDDN